MAEVVVKGNFQRRIRLERPTDSQSMWDKQADEQVDANNGPTAWLGCRGNHLLRTNRFFFQRGEHHVQKLVRVMFVGRNDPAQCVQRT